MYLSVYTDFPHFTLAREMIKRHKNIAHKFWAQRFKDMEIQIREYETDQVLGREVDEEEQNQIQKVTNRELAE